MKIAIVVGVRPEFIKMAPLIKLCEEKKIEYFVIHTGQHYVPVVSALESCNRAITIPWLSFP